jgi:hypothetical protein
LSSVFELMRLLDREHFEAMCAALDLDKDALIAAASPRIDVREPVPTTQEQLTLPSQ